MQEVSKVLAGVVAGRLVLLPCVIVSSTPPVVSIRGASVPAAFVDGLTYPAASTGVALLPETGLPLVFPTIGA